MGPTGSGANRSNRLEDGKIIKPDGYIDLGDTGEWSSVSHWQWKKKRRPPLEYQLPSVIKEIEEVNMFKDDNTVIHFK